MTQHPPQNLEVRPLQPALLQGKLSLIASPFRQVAGTQKQGCQHGDSCKGHQQRSNQRERDREGEWQEESTHQPLDEGQRHENDNRGHGGRKNRWGHLRRRFQGGAPPVSPSLYVAVDVLQHNDRIVHHSSHRDGQPSQGHEVQAHVLPTHQENTGEDTQRNGQTYDNGRAQSVEQPTRERGSYGKHEGENDGDRKEEPEHPLSDEAVDLLLNLRALVSYDYDFNVGRHSVDGGQGLVYRSGDVQSVGLRLLGHRNAEASLAVGAGNAIGPACAKAHPSHIGKPHHPGLGCADDEVSDLLDRVEGMGGLYDHRP